MDLEPVTRVIAGKECFHDDDLFNLDRFKRFANKFNVKSTAYGYEVLKTPDYFCRWLSAYGRQARMRRTDYWNGSFEHMLERNGLHVHLHFLFDHIDAHKTGNNFHFITSMPYSTPELSINAFNRLKQCSVYGIGGLKMYFLPHKYKFRKNGDFMLLFCYEGSELEDIIELFGLDNYIPEEHDKWSEEVK